MRTRAKMSSSDAKTPEPAANSHIASALRTLDTEAEGVAALAAAMSDGLGAPFVAAVETIRAARGRVIVTGMGKSGHVARKIAATLASTGTPAFFVHAADASHGDLGMITSDDVMLALSWSGETEELKDLINYSRRFRIVLIAITVNVESTLGKARMRQYRCFSWNRNLFIIIDNIEIERTRRIDGAPDTAEHSLDLMQAPQQRRW